MASEHIGIATYKFSEAKTNLSHVMSGVVRAHRPVVIARRAEEAVLADRALLDPLLERFDFTTTATASDGEIVLHQKELNLIAGGQTFEEAAAELEELADQRVHQLFERCDFYLQTDQRDQLPFALRLALASDSEERRALLVGGTPAPA